MFGAIAAIDALGAALASGSPEPVIEDAGNWVLDTLRDTVALRPATPRGAAAQIDIRMLADSTTGRFNTTGLTRSVRSGGKLLRGGRSGVTAAEIRSAKKAYGCKCRRPEFRAFGSGCKKKKKKKKKKKTAPKRRKSYMTYDVFA